MHHFSFRFICRGHVFSLLDAHSGLCASDPDNMNISLKADFSASDNSVIYI